MGRLITVGDIHGRFSKLKGLIEEIGPQKDDTLVFLGDYIDRGPDSYEVVNSVVQMQKEFPHTVTLRGNHEDFIISLFLSNQNSKERDIWLKMNGGDQTLASYKGAGRFLEVHQEFYMNLPVSWETEQYFFAMPGGAPEFPLQSREPSISWKFANLFSIQRCDLEKSSFTATLRLKNLKYYPIGSTLIQEPGIMALSPPSSCLH